MDDVPAFAQPQTRVDVRLGRYVNCSGATWHALQLLVPNLATELRLARAAAFCSLACATLCDAMWPQQRRAAVARDDS